MGFCWNVRTLDRHVRHSVTEEKDESSERTEETKESQQRHGTRRPLVRPSASRVGQILTQLQPTQRYKTRRSTES